MINIAPIKLRVISGILDILIYLFFYQLIILIWVSSSTIPSLLNSLILLLVFFIIVYPLLLPLISIIFISTLGGTLGKLITGVEIVDEKGAKISFLKAFFRNYAGFIISGLPFFLGFIWIAIDKERRGWHDMIAGTYVVVRSKAGMIVGIIGIIVVLVINIFLANGVLTQAKSNRQVYLDIITEIKSSVSKMFDKPTTKIPFEKTDNYPDQPLNNLFETDRLDTGVPL